MKIKLILLGFMAFFFTLCSFAEENDLNPAVDEPLAGTNLSKNSVKNPFVKDYLDPMEEGEVIELDTPDKDAIDNDSW